MKNMFALAQQRPEKAQTTRRLNLSEIANLYRNKPEETSIGPRGYIGPAGGPAGEKPNRAKGFLEINGNSTNAVDSILDAVIYGIRGMQGREIRDEPLPSNSAFLADCTRLSVRAVVSDDMMGYLRFRARALGINMEAAMPTSRGSNIVYLGHNQPSREATEEERERFAHIADDYKNKKPRETLHESLSSFFEQGYQIETFKGGLPADYIQKIAGFLEKEFGYNFESASNVLRNPNNLVGVATHNGRIVGTCVLEKNEISLQGAAPITIGEITDSVALNGNGHEKKGIHSAMTTALLSRAVDEKIDVVFGESTLDQEHQTVIHTAQRQGRELRGVLENHTYIGGKLVSLAVTHVSPDQLRVIKSVYEGLGELKRS